MEFYEIGQDPCELRTPGQVVQNAFVDGWFAWRMPGCQRIRSRIERGRIPELPQNCSVSDPSRAVSRLRWR
jgi:hypothetical protein